MALLLMRRLQAREVTPLHTRWMRKAAALQL